MLLHRWADGGDGRGEALPSRMSGLSMDHPQYAEQLAALGFPPGSAPPGEAPPPPQQ